MSVPAFRRGADGFTLIELLVVMIIIGILAAIAIPVFLTQRTKARDTATQSDVARLGKEVAAYFVDGQGPAVITYVAAGGGAPATAQVTDAGGFVGTVLTLSQGTVQPGANATANLANSTTWCVALTNAEGSTRTYHYSGTAGLQPGAC